MNDDSDRDDEPINGPALLAGGLALAGAAYWFFSGKQEKHENPLGQGPSSNVTKGVSNENDLKDYVKRNIRVILKTAGNPQLIAEEWFAPSAHIGKGDLVYHFRGTDFVIELKWIDFDGVNDSNRLKSTVKNTNRQKKIDVKKQAEKYGQFWLDNRGRTYDVQAIAIINDVFGDAEIIHREVLPCRKKHSFPRYPVCGGCGDCTSCLVFEG